MINLSNKPLFHVVIPDRVGIKKNSKRIAVQGRRRFLISSDKYKEWEGMASVYVKDAKNKQITRPIDYYVTGVFRFYFKNRANEIDTTNGAEGIQDILETQGVLANDKFLKNVYCEKFFDEEPRVEAFILPYQSFASEIGKPETEEGMPTLVVI